MSAGTNADSFGQLSNSTGAGTPEIYFLDTNAYALLLRSSPSDADTRLRAKLSCGTYLTAVVSEITALEIHSVIGQLSRGQSGGFHLCDRQVEQSSGLSRCTQRWSQPSRRPLRPLEIDRLRKVIKDAENGHGPIRITVHPLESSDFVLGKAYLYANAHVCRFGSYDAVIAAAASRYMQGANVRVVTSDSGLKSLLRLVSRSYFDPLKNEIWDPP
jgi:hypothetical protein